MTDMTDFEKMERDGWADPSIAKSYADGFETATRLSAEKLADAVKAAPGRDILDLCTGHGVVAAELVARGASVIGLDFSDPMIALAKTAVPQADFVQGDATAMTFSDAQFDAITIGFGVPHFPDPQLGLHEAARILKGGGKLAFSIWRGKGSKGAFGWLFDAVGRLGDSAVTLPAGPDAHMFVDLEIAKPMLENAGFVDVQLADVATEVDVQNPDALFDLFDAGAVRAASLLGQQPHERRDAIRADLANRTLWEGRKERYIYVVPTPSVVISAVRAQSKTE